MKILQASYSACGKRSENQDSLLVKGGASGVLAVVADGVGGSEHGELASSGAVEMLAELLLAAPITESAIEDAVVRTHEALSRSLPNARTTVAVVAFGANEAFAAHVGDTRIYQFRNGRICFQSVDHSVAQMAVYAGEISSDGIRTHPERNRLTRVVGGTGVLGLDVRELEIRENDRFLICSDGFWGKLSEADMERLCAASHSLQEWLSSMRAMVEAREGDNHTAVVLSCTSVGTAV